MGFTAGYKVNVGTDYEFTVSDETIAEVVQDTGIDEMDIGEYCYSALIDSRVAKIVATQHHTSFEPDWESTVRSSYYTYFSATSPLTSSVPTFNKDLLNSTDEVYQRNFLMWYGTIYPNTENEKTGEFLVMDMKDIKKWYLNFDNAGFSTTPESVTSAVYDQVPLPEGYTWQGYTGNAYRYIGNTIAHASMGTVDSSANVDKNLYVINVINFNDQLAIGELNPSSHGQSDIGMEDVRYAGMSDEWLNRYGGYFNPGSPQRSYQGVAGNWGAVGDYRRTPEYPAAPRGDLASVSFDSWAELSNDEMLYQLTGNWGQQYNSCNMQGAQLSITKNLNIFLKWQSWCGLLFEFNGIRYKPIIEQGVVVGYSSDMSTPSEWDEMTNVTGNNISPTPPSPRKDKDDFDDHEMGAGTGISGMANLWLLTASQLSDLHASCNSAPVGFDPLNSFISVMGLGINPELITHEIQFITPINIRMSDGTTWQTHVEGHIVDSQVSAFQFTGIRVQRRFDNFLDYSPYAVHEIFLPCCGWVTLPDIAVNRSITVTYLPDIESLKCRAVVSVVDNDGNRCVVGEKDGILGADVPFTNTGHSLFVGDAIVNGADIAGEAITMAIGANFTKKTAKGSSYRPYEGFTLGGAGTLPGAIGNAFVSGNLNRTHFLTGNGTRVGFSDGENIQIKSTYHEIDMPDNYPHTVGLMCNKTDKLSKFKGFTVCDNPHITFSALEAEKEEIKSLLEEGVIL